MAGVSAVISMVGCRAGPNLSSIATDREIKVKQYRLCELTFKAAVVPENPWTKVNLSARFTGPHGQVFNIGGFFDGGRTWKVRFCPPSSGQWTYVTECDHVVSTLGGRSGNLVVSAADGDNPLFRHGGILKVSANGRHLTYTDGTPFFWLGDTWWFCPSDLVPIDGSSRPDCPSTYRHLIDKRKSQGFTAIQMAFMGALDKVEPITFMKARSGEAFDIDYWRKVDRYMDYANQAGIVPVVGIDWGATVAQHSLEDWRFLWRYVVARYGSHAVTWLLCGEYNHVQSPQQVERVIELGRHVRRVDPYRRAMTVHPFWYGSEGRQAWSEDWCDFIMLQGGHLGHGEVPSVKLYLGAYRRPKPKPLLESECNYEGIYAGNHTQFPNRQEITAEDVRRSAYQAIQCGSLGFTYGSHGLWYPTQNGNDATCTDWGQTIPWWQSLARPGGEQMGHLRKCYESVQWWLLEPWPDAVRVTGIDRTDIAVHRTGKQVVSAEPLVKGSNNPLQAVVYFPPDFPTQAKCTLILTRKMPGRLTARWFDPRTGEAKPIDTVPQAGEERWDLPRPPDMGDWVLIVSEQAR